ncbi:MAG TPA: HPF/RaiA family ribosome-associated protein [Planctomycetota bacterium]|nr:HPF/RaiA family ribosome-associated protein [Planctomycetota bacterium]
MTINIHSNRFKITPAIRTFAEEAVESHLGRFTSRIQSVTIRLSDINGLRGGEDKRCSVTVSLARRGNVFVEETVGDLYASIAKALECASQVVTREVERRQNSRTKTDKDAVA